MAKINVGVLRGGPSSEYDISLKTGESVIANLLKEKYEVHDVLWTKDGVWHLDGFPKPVEKILRKVDVIFNAMHGEHGEDGKVQQILERYSMRYTGSGIVPSAAGMNKIFARQIFENAGIKTPRAVFVSTDDNLHEKTSEAYEKMSPWWMVKPVSRGSSVGASLAKSKTDIFLGIKKSLGHDKRALIEEHITGREATCGVLENFRGHKFYPLPVVEIIPPKGRFFDYENKYNGKIRLICPGRFGLDISKKIQQAAVLAHTAISSKHYSRTDFIVSLRGIFVLEINTLPALGLESSYVRSAEAIGLSFPLLLDHLLKEALKK